MAQEENIYTLNKILKYVYKSLATPGTQYIFGAKVMKCISIKILGSKLSFTVKILPENLGKLFLWTFEPLKNIFCSKIVNLLSIGVRKSGTSEKNYINQKLKILAYLQSKNVNRNPRKTFFQILILTVIG